MAESDEAGVRMEGVGVEGVGVEGFAYCEGGFRFGTVGETG